MPVVCLRHVLELDIIESFHQLVNGGSVHNSAKSLLTWLMMSFELSYI